MTDIDDRVTRAQAAELLGVSLGRFDVIARSGLLKSREYNAFKNRTTYSRAEVEELRRKREGS
jgi:hypothetical protein